MNNTGLFSGLSQVYEAGRPSYAEGFLEDLFGLYGLRKDSPIADIGAGTGKFAKQLLKKGAFVYCVEPNADMRKEATQQLSHFPNCAILDGTAEATGLPAESVDAITVAQAFHWFDGEAFRKECWRILKPNGQVFLLWNMRASEAEITKELHNLYTKYCSKYRGFNGGIAVQDERIWNFFQGQYQHLAYNNPQLLTKEVFHNRCQSSSYALRPEDADYTEFCAAIDGLFEKYAQKGLLDMPTETHVYIGQLHALN